MFNRRARILIIVFLGILPGVAANEVQAQQKSSTIRVATFNCSLNRSREGQLSADLMSNDAQATSVAAVLRHVRPDIVLLNEFDFDPQHVSQDLFRSRFLRPRNRISFPVGH
ncbi:MAG: endonuclease/exonuclease/phosphatase family protein [Planctomycetaceae bacterium]